MDCYCDYSFCWFWSAILWFCWLRTERERGEEEKKYHGFMAVNFQEAKIISIVQIHI
jgi:hypothetical protein